MVEVVHATPDGGPRPASDDAARGISFLSFEWGFVVDDAGLVKVIGSGSSLAQDERWGEALTVAGVTEEYNTPMLRDPSNIVIDKDAIEIHEDDDKESNFETDDDDDDDDDDDNDEDDNEDFDF
ncbi:aspartic acid-rich protein-like [Zingiber officinale]|uniref:aspartic acid-rich protein-like n=1 Tax=Zingiber officinale TaxID=94328 RepID=UPI001C4C6E64|nr:aspartic acid-rich protein-like [Zingiber officinale]